MEHEDSPKGAISVLWEQRDCAREWPGAQESGFTGDCGRERGSMVATVATGEASRLFLSFQNGSQASGGSGSWKLPVAHLQLLETWDGVGLSTAQPGFYLQLHKPQNLHGGCLLTASPHSHFSRPRTHPAMRFHCLGTVGATVCLVGGGSEIFNYLL